MNGYPHGKHSYQKAGAKYGHGSEALRGAKKLYDSENDSPYYNDGNNVSAKHSVMFLLHKGMLFSAKCVY